MVRGYHLNNLHFPCSDKIAIRSLNYYYFNIKIKRDNRNRIRKNNNRWKYSFLLTIWTSSTKHLTNGRCGNADGSIIWLNDKETKHSFKNKWKFTVKEVTVRSWQESYCDIMSVDSQNLWLLIGAINAVKRMYI